MVLHATLENLIQLIEAPYTQQTLQQLKAIKKIEMTAQAVLVCLEFGYPADAGKAKLQQSIQAILDAQKITVPLQLAITWKVSSHKIQQGLQGVHGIKNIIAIGSGKGGVGKSTVSANLAIALAQMGATVGLLDADIYGPSQPLIMGAADGATSDDKKSINPVLRHGVKVMSIGYLVDTKAPVIWRGPMVSGALQQLLNDTRWGELDYLIIDLPPGTGDIQLTMAQKIPVSGAVVVTTPQDLSLMDARRAIGMFNKVQIPILGVVENMSLYHCPSCGHTDTIFGDAGGQSLSEEFNTVLLGKLPLDKTIRADADAGIPTVAANPQGSIAQHYREIALTMAARLSLQAKSYASKFPKIVVEHN